MSVAAGALALVALVALPASGAGKKERPVVGGAKLAHLSQGVSVRYYAANPHLAPAPFRERFEHVAEAASAARERSGQAAFRGQVPDVFNNDDFGVPQNEESVGVCRTNDDIVLGGTNDFRGILDEQGNFTGWHFSNDGGRTLTNEGLLPPVPLLSDHETEVPSGGDPVDVIGAGCATYAASLAYDPSDPLGNSNGIAVYKSDPATLATCDTAFPNSANPACWPIRRLVVEGVGIPEPTPATPGHFLDKEWMDVGVSGAAGEVVWVTYSDFAATGPGDFDFSAEIFAVRCDAADLDPCTAPISISVDDFDVQFSDVTIAPDGRVYVTWSEIIGELPDDPDCPQPDGCAGQTFVHKLRVAEPGSTTFGPERVVYREEKAIPFGGALHANDFRIATYAKNDVAILNGRPRIFVTWDACRFRPLETICEESLIKLVYSDDDGKTWSNVIELSVGGDNYFPSIAANDDSAQPLLAFAWFTNREDAVFHNRQLIEVLSLDPKNPTSEPHGRRQLMPQLENESEADPLLGGFFIGDYIEVAALGDEAIVHYNANYRSVQLLGPLGIEGVPVPQQDNYLNRVRFRGQSSRR